MTSLITYSAAGSQGILRDAFLFLQSGIRLQHRKDVDIMDSKEAGRIISSVGGTMAMEGLPLTEENKDRLRECLEGRKSFEEYFRGIDERHRR